MERFMEQLPEEPFEAGHSSRTEIEELLSSLSEEEIELSELTYEEIEVPGRVNESLSMDEYEGFLRVVTTVQKYQASQVTDDRTGEVIYLEYMELSRSNGLYILSEDLSVKGKIDGLAKDELIYPTRRNR